MSDWDFFVQHFRVSLKAMLFALVVLAFYLAALPLWRRKK